MTCLSASDEKPDATDSEQPPVDIRGVNEDFQLMSERLDLVYVKGNTGADNSFQNCEIFKANINGLEGTWLGLLVTGPRL
jgi:hypothetical protein